MSRLPRLLLLSAVMLAGCTGGDRRFRDETVFIGGFHTLHNPPAGFKGHKPDKESHWDGDNLEGSPSIKISLSEQKAYFFKGGKLAGVSTVSTGREGFNTETGSFHI